MEYYLTVEPVDAIRDEALDHSYPVEERIRFSIRNGLGTVSDLISRWPLPDPEAGGQEGQASVNCWGKKIQTDAQ